jgi:hypothetical protein
MTRLTVLLLSVVFCVSTAVAQKTAVPKTKKPQMPAAVKIWPKDFFPDFPKVTFGMSFADAKALLEKMGIQPGLLRGNENELAWDGKFAGLSGRATMFFKPATGAWEIAVIAYDLDKPQEKQKETYAKWLKKIEAKHGAATEKDDSSFAISNVWKFKDGIGIELRMPKDIESPVVDIHWVKF